MNLATIIILLQAVIGLLSNPATAANPSAQALAQQAIVIATEALTQPPETQLGVIPTSSQPFTSILPTSSATTPIIINITPPPQSTQPPAQSFGASTFATTTPIAKTKLNLWLYGGLSISTDTVDFQFSCAGINRLRDPNVTRTLTISGQTYDFPADDSADLVLNKVQAGLSDIATNGVQTAFYGKVNWYPYTLHCENEVNYWDETGDLAIPIKQ